LNLSNLLFKNFVDSSIVLVEIAHLLNINCPDLLTIGFDNLLPGINLDNHSGSLNGISIPIIPSVFNSLVGLSVNL